MRLILLFLASIPAFCQTISSYNSDAGRPDWVRMQFQFRGAVVSEFQWFKHPALDPYQGRIGVHYSYGLIILDDLDYSKLAPKSDRSRLMTINSSASCEWIDSSIFGRLNVPDHIAFCSNIPVWYPISRATLGVIIFRGSLSRKYRITIGYPREVPYVDEICMENLRKNEPRIFRDTEGAERRCRRYKPIHIMGNLANLSNEFLMPNKSLRVQGEIGP